MKILLLEDDEILCESLKEYLKAEGFEVDLEAADLAGSPFQEDGYTVSLGAVRSVEARAVRLLVDLIGFDTGDELWIIDPTGPRVFGPFTGDDAEGDGILGQVIYDDSFDSTQVSLLYDAAGNLIDDGIYLYKYDAWNRLVEVQRKAATGDAAFAGGAFSELPKVGFEPTRGCPQRILSPPRLPFRHSGIKPQNKLFKVIHRHQLCQV